MEQLGLCVNPGMWPDRRELERLRPRWLRTIIYDTGELLARLDETPEDVRVIALLNGEHHLVQHDWSNWPRAIAEVVGRLKGRIHALEILNEWDILGVPSETSARLARQSAVVCREAGIVPLLGSVAGPGWTGALRAATDLLDDRTRELLGGVCFHPYGQRADGWPRADWGFGELADVIGTAYGVAGLPVWLTEFGIHLRDAGGSRRQAEHFRRAAGVIRRFGPEVVPAACWFAWRDEIGMPHERGPLAFGLRGVGGRPRRLAWSAFRREGAA